MRTPSSGLGDLESCRVCDIDGDKLGGSIGVACVMRVVEDDC